MKKIEVNKVCFHIYVIAMCPKGNTYLNKSWTAFASSGPIPSPGISVTVCQPPYFAGGGDLKNPYNTSNFTNNYNGN